jgi:hypothetical protein
LAFKLPIKPKILFYLAAARLSFISVPERSQNKKEREREKHL